MRATVMVSGVETNSNLGQWEFAAIPAVGDQILLAAQGRQRRLRVREIEHRPTDVRIQPKLGMMAAPATIILADDLEPPSGEGTLNG